MTWDSDNPSSRLSPGFKVSRDVGTGVENWKVQEA
jgi:hypothetical protein